MSDRAIVGRARVGRRRPGPRRFRGRDPRGLPHGATAPPPVRAERAPARPGSPQGLPGLSPEGTRGDLRSGRGRGARPGGQPGRGPFAPLRPGTPPRPLKLAAIAPTMPTVGATRSTAPGLRRSAARQYPNNRTIPTARGAPSGGPRREATRTKPMASWEEAEGIDEETGRGDLPLSTTRIHSDTYRSVYWTCSGRPTDLEYLPFGIRRDGWSRVGKSEVDRDDSNGRSPG